MFFASGGAPGGPPGAFWGHFGGLLGRLGAIMGRLGAVLGRPEAILCRLDAPVDSEEGREAKIIVFPSAFVGFRIGARNGSATRRRPWGGLRGVALQCIRVQCFAIGLQLRIVAGPWRHTPVLSDCRDASLQSGRGFLGLRHTADPLGAFPGAAGLYSDALGPSRRLFRWRFLDFPRQCVWVVSWGWF